MYIYSFKLFEKFIKNSIQLIRMQFARILDHNFSHNMIRIKVSFNVNRFTNQ